MSMSSLDAKSQRPHGPAMTIHDFSTPSFAYLNSVEYPPLKNLNLGYFYTLEGDDGTEPFYPRNVLPCAALVTKGDNKHVISIPDYEAITGEKLPSQYEQAAQSLWKSFLKNQPSRTGLSLGSGSDRRQKWDVTVIDCMEAAHEKLWSSSTDYTSTNIAPRYLTYDKFIQVFPQCGEPSLVQRKDRWFGPIMLRSVSQEGGPNQLSFYRKT